MRELLMKKHLIFPRSKVGGSKVSLIDLSANIQFFVVQQNFFLLSFSAVSSVASPLR